MKCGTEDEYPSELWFDLELTDAYSDWKGKLIVTWPPPEISWARWADRNEFSVKAILEESILVKAMPSWDELLLTWEELKHLPKSWVQALCQWRGLFHSRRCRWKGIRRLGLWREKPAWPLVELR
jgi:hypothetical protein